MPGRAEYCEACPGKGELCASCEWGSFLLDPLNHPIVDLWFAALTQQRPNGSLDYPALNAVAGWLDLDLRIPRLRRGIQLLETENLKRLAKASSENE